MDSILSPVTLTGRLVTLEPLHRDHESGLAEAVRDGELWNLWYTSVPRPEDMAAEIDSRLARAAAGQMLPFATRRNSDGRLIGMTSYCSIDPDVPRVEIGYTWNARSAQGTGTNPESKRLLLAHAFDTLGCEAVCFVTHWMNQQSRAAIARLGAKQDGVLRAHRRSANGSLRDSVIFSILRSEWPMVRAGLDLRLSERTQVSPKRS
jgi:RimJ/RimL family protein N-acetyltransferase